MKAPFSLEVGMWFDVEMEFRGGTTMSQEADSEEEAIELVSARLVNLLPVGSQWSETIWISTEEIK